MMPEHPVVEALLRTGRPWPQPRGLVCWRCGCPIRQEEPYYDIFDYVLCPACVAECRRYA